MKRGEIGPDDLVEYKFRTDGEWMEARNVRVFDKLSPTRHPPGESLLQKLLKQSATEANKLLRYAAVAAAIGIA